MDFDILDDDFFERVGFNNDFWQMLDTEKTAKEIAESYNISTAQVEYIQKEYSMHLQRVEELVQENKRLKVLIEEKAAGLGCKDKIIYDGVAFPDEYVDRSPRILWILKESYETNNCYGWYSSEIYEGNPAIHKKGTLRQVCLITYCILHKCNYETACKADDKKLVDAIQRVGWINLNKIAAEKTSPQDLTPQYTIWKDVLKEQIKAYNPQVIICGHTLEYFSNDNNYFGLPRGEKKIFNSINPNPGNIYGYYAMKDRLYINIHHPSYLMDWGECINEMVNAVSNWKKIQKEN